VARLFARAPASHLITLSSGLQLGWRDSDSLDAKGIGSLSGKGCETLGRDCENRKEMNPIEAGWES